MTTTTIWISSTSIRESCSKRCDLHFPFHCQCGGMVRCDDCMRLSRRHNDEQHALSCVQTAPESDVLEPLPDYVFDTIEAMRARTTKHYIL